MDTETTASLRSRSRQFEEIHLFQFNRGRVDHVLARGRNASSSSKNEKTGAISRTREERSDVSARRRRGREVASGGLDRSVRVWKATAWCFVFYFRVCVIFLSSPLSFSARVRSHRGHL